MRSHTLKPEDYLLINENAPADPTHIPFKKLFADDDNWSMYELELKLESLQARQPSEHCGKIDLYDLFRTEIPDELLKFKDHIQLLLGGLTSKEFSVLNMFLVELYTEKEICKELNISRRTMRTYRERGLKKVFLNLKEKMPHSTFSLQRKEVQLLDKLSELQ